MDSKSAKNGSSVRKRPEIALYKPGMGKILAKKGDNESPGPQKSETTEESKTDNQQRNELKCDSKQSENKSNNNFNNNNKSVNKKPDIKVYVPPKQTTNNSSTSDKISEKSSEKSNQRTTVQNIDKSDRSERRHPNNSRTGNRQKPDRNEKRDRIERNDSTARHEKTDRRTDTGRDRHARHDRHERSDRHERNDRNVRQRIEKTDKYEKHEKTDRSDRSEHQKKEKTPQLDKHFDRHSAENYTKIKNFEQNKHKSNEVFESTAQNEDTNNRKAKHFEPKLSHNLDANHEMKFEVREEEYDDYYNLEFSHNLPKDMSKSHKNVRHNRSSGSNSGNAINRTENNYNSNENKSRNKPENSNQRKYATKAPHNRYVNTYEQQIPPRFLRLKKQNEMQNELMAEPTHYEQQTRDSVEEQPQQSSAEPQPHRGLIRLPSNNQITDWSTGQTTIESNPSFQTLSHSHHMNSGQKPINASKPCVVIRPTQHVTAVVPQYSPSSSPDTNSNVDNYQQLSPYLRTNNYSEYAIPHFMTTTSAESHENSRKKLKPNIEKSLTEAVAAENDLMLCMNDQQKLEQIRYRIQLRYEHVILNDLRVCAELNIEQRLWKSAFYQFIEHYRRLMDQNTEQQSELKTSLHKIIDEASLFFENLLVKMQETYNFVIEKLLAHEYDSETENYDTLKLASISAQKIYLYLGDLSRYRECETRNSNFVKSKFFYLRAQMLAPKNGRSYNQLALLAMYQNRRLDAVYYYMRSLAASNPFLTARENLLAIFDEVRRKYELNEKKRKQDLVNQKKRIEEQLDNSLTSDKERIEIWIRSDGTSAVCSNVKQLFEETEDPKDELDSLSSVDLNKRFVLSFLHTHGKLFSRVGMESFIPVVNQMLAEFRSLLGRSPVPVMSQRLSQLLAINMFAVFHTSLKEAQTYAQNCRSLLQEQAIQVTFAMISLLLECAINSLKQKRIETNSDQISDDLSELLPTIKLWTDWMSCQKQLWCPPPPPSDFKLDCRGDVWSIFAQFLTLLTKINVRSVKLLGSRLEGCEPIILPEDTSLAGFLPLLGSPQCVQFAQPPYDKEKARTCLRITAIQYFGDYLCGIVEPYLKYDVEKKRFVSLIPTVIQSNVEEIAKTINELEISETENDELSNDMSSVETTSSVNVNELSARTGEQTEIEKLWSLQEKLKKAKDRQETIKQTIDAVLSEENQRKPSRIVVQPRYIIPDTNCYIDHLDQIKRLINSKYYDLIVPLIVINELNGLKARGIKTAKPLTFSDDHIGNVGKIASETIDYLMTAFNDKSLRLKAITSKGSLLENMNFISESLVDSQGNSNDDLILKACLHFIEDKSEKTTKESAMNSVESNSIFRESVLLTDDRNLRVKALGHNVPVKSLTHFINWANIPSEKKCV